MSKVTLNNISNLQNENTAVTTINGNSATIETAFDNTLSRDGSTPNQMEATLDMNSNAIINLPYPTDVTSPLRLQDLNDFESGIVLIPPGGTTGQSLTKKSNTDYDVDWALTTVPAPTATTLGGVKSIAPVSSKWINSIGTDGTPALSQPDFTDLNVNTTGTGNVVLSTSPTLTTPTLGVATATSINGVTLPFAARTRQVFASGSGTYTTPANVKYLSIRMVGGGGGGAGGGTSGGAGGSGGATTFGSSFLTCNGGVGGTGASSSSGGAGGTATGGSVNIVGGRGGNAQTLVNGNGGQGAASPFGGSGNLGTSGGASGIASGSGSGGGGGGNTTGTCGGGGGGSGGYLEAIVTSPSATYAYAIGTAGTGGSAGTNGNAGSAGAVGIIIIDEFYA